MDVSKVPEAAVSKCNNRRRSPLPPDREGDVALPWSCRPIFHLGGVAIGAWGVPNVDVPKVTREAGNQ